MRQGEEQGSGGRVLFSHSASVLKNRRAIVEALSNALSTAKNQKKMASDRRSRAEGAEALERGAITTGHAGGVGRGV